jgi:hypothetical protein
MYVKTTAVEQLATTASTTHIAFLWTMVALVAGAALTASCIGLRGSGKKKDSESDKSDDDSSDSEDN